MMEEVSIEEGAQAQNTEEDPISGPIVIIPPLLTQLWLKALQEIVNELFSSFQRMIIRLFINFE